MPQVKQNPEKPVDPEILADAIVQASESLKKLLSSGLNRKAIIVLIAADSGLHKTTVDTVMTSLTNLRATYCTK